MVTHGYETQIAALKSQIEHLQNTNSELEVQNRDLFMARSLAESNSDQLKTELKHEMTVSAAWAQKYNTSEMDNTRLKAEIETVRTKVLMWESEISQV